MENILSNTTQATLDYERIEKAILFIEQNYTRQPGLKEIADSVHLSEFHFERMFTRWAGTTPQRFMRYLTKEYARQLLDHSKDILEVTYTVGLSSPGRLHDLFVTYEAMSPGEYKHKDNGLEIKYGFHPTPFGECLIAVTRRGICSLTFQPSDARQKAIFELEAAWIGTKLSQDQEQTKRFVVQIFSPVSTNSTKPIHLLLKGTNFQIKVWEALLKIPAGNVVCYEAIASYIGNPNALRAVGTACGHNHISYLIPCHRVLQKAGGIGGYRWSTSRKKAMLGWEQAQLALIE